MTGVLLKLNRPLSVSQRNQYIRCPWSYKLARIDKVWQRPAAWLPQGSAVHAVLEYWEKNGRQPTYEDLVEVFSTEYQKEVAQYTEVTPNFDYWFMSGPYHAEEDLPRRYEIGLEQVQKYIDWTEAHPEEKVWFAPSTEEDKTPDDSGAIGDYGKPAIELPFSIDLDGTKVRGFIDLVIEHPEYGVMVRDHKTGNSPGDDFQLGVYSVALHLMYGIDQPQFGDYWMGKTGKATIPYKIGDWTVDRVTEEFKLLEQNILAERFDPDPDPKKCGFCDVNASCNFFSA